MPNRRSKVVSAAGALGAVQDGGVVGIGGMMLSRRPVALCRALAVSGAENLEVVSLTASIETDILIEAGTVRTLRTSMMSLGLFGFAPAWSEAISAGRLRSLYETEMSIVLGLRASLAGVGFEPAVAWQGTDYFDARPDVMKIVCPYTGEEYTAFPRIVIDVALVHALAADPHGNAFLGVDLGIDRELVRSARTTVVSAERLLETHELEALGEPDVLGRDVEYVVESPMGAAPTACSPQYDIDAATFLRWAEQRDLPTGGNP